MVRAAGANTAGSAGRANAGPNAKRGNGSGRRAGATGADRHGPGGRTATSAGGGAPGAVTRGRDCPGGEQQDKNSTYSPPCLHFSGDNGGATSKGVAGDTITVAMREPEMFDVGTNNQGRITDTPADLKRSLLAFVDYFNRVYQTYGRKVQIVFYKAKTPMLAGAEGGHQEEANADALTVGQEIKAFADLAASAPAYADALVRQGVVGYGTFHMSKSWYQAHAPYAWARPARLHMDRRAEHRLPRQASGAGAGQVGRRPGDADEAAGHRARRSRLALVSGVRQPRRRPLQGGRVPASPGG